MIITIVTFCFGAALAALAAAEDWRTHLLRNVYTGPMALVAVVGFGLAGLVGGESIDALAVAAGAAVFAGPWLLSFLISPASIGFGDVKYAVGLGLYLGRIGPRTALTGLLIACAVGGVFAVGFARTRRGEPFPFGPSLLAGATVSVALTLATPG